jgi:hypothetical protein
MIKRSGLVLLVLIVALVFSAGALSANGGSEFPITWELSGPTCSQLPAGMTIEGTGTGTVFFSQNGSIHVAVTGTATDGNGGFWRFNYVQNGRPLGGGAVEVSDHFNLVGSGSPIKLHSHFVIDFTTIELENAEILAVKQVHGDPEFCDPI